MVLLAEAWHSAWAQGAEIVLWPSAYGGGFNMRAYAALYGLRIIPAGWGDIIDITGRVAEGLQCECSGKWGDWGGKDDCGYCAACRTNCSACLCHANLDLDKTIVHSDMGGPTGGPVDQLIAASEGAIEDEFVPEYCAVPGKCAGTGDLAQQSNLRILRLTASGRANASRSVRKALHEANIEPLRHYQQRARFAINRW